MTVMDVAQAMDHEQQLYALGVANRIRSHRARFKKQLKTGERSLQDVLDQILQPGPLMESMKVRELLIAVPMMGPTKADKILRKCNMTPAKRLSGLTGRQRIQLVQELA